MEFRPDPFRKGSPEQNLNGIERQTLNHSLGQKEERELNESNVSLGS
jgi:hypothetical protein